MSVLNVNDLEISIELDNHAAASIYGGLYRISAVASNSLHSRFDYLEQGTLGKYREGQEDVTTRKLVWSL